ncbi:hypothetical protein O6H91_15G026600 [Diphasiastrum complanatum]|uniref:Uncharacterized protein n=1 Tax=Diphasiastrum complanatum TaxID=34168 RepID=A0ACC2BGT3_DIPCM|nr:hypothetical protein O6H91_15G026600 [Diphasiastrum complanatum]
MARRVRSSSKYNPRSADNIHRGFWKGCLAAICCCCVLDECCCDPTVVITDN